MDEARLLGSLLSLGLKADALLPELEASLFFKGKKLDWKRMLNSDSYRNDPEAELVALDSVLAALRDGRSNAGFAHFTEKVIETLIRSVELIGLEARQTIPALSLAGLMAFLYGLELLQVESIFVEALPLSGRPTSQDRLVESVYQVCQARVRPVAGGQPSISWVAAAILSTLGEFRRPDFRFIRGNQAGMAGRDGQPRLLPVVLGELDEAEKAGNVLIQTSMDDMSPQLVAYTIERLFEAGALDVYQVPITMKKNRLGIQLNVTARQQDEAKLAGIILSETSTLGVNIRPLDHRYHAEIRMVTVETKYGVIPVKQKYWEGRLIQSKPEYEVTAKAAAQFQVSLEEVNYEIQAQLHGQPPQFNRR